MASRLWPPQQIANYKGAGYRNAIAMPIVAVQSNGIASKCFWTQKRFFLCVIRSVILAVRRNRNEPTHYAGTLSVREFVFSHAYRINT